jgi:two-component system, cell cycle sensor histidine kinase and response regulator CckA
MGTSIRLPVPRLPQEPLARFRFMSVCFAATLAFFHTVLFTIDQNLPSSLRWEEAAAAATLGTWWIYGYRRGRFPVAGWLVDMTLVLVVAAVSPMPSDAIALFFGGLQFRSLFVPRRQLGYLIVSYSVARVGSTALWYSNGHIAYSPLSPNSLISVLGLTIIAVSLHLFVEATQRQSTMARDLARSDERYRLVARATRDVVYDWHVATGKIVWTESMQSVFGYAPEEIGDGAWWLERVHPADRETLQHAVEAAVADPTMSIGTVQYRVRRADQHYAYVSGSLIVQRAADGTAERVIGSIRDVTSEHLLEERLRQAQKMEAVGQLAGGVAHDFNNLLTVIGGHVYMLENGSGSATHGSGDGSASAKHLAGITRATDRAASLTRQLLAFGRKQLLSPSVLDVNAIVDDTLHMMRPALGERVKVITRLQRGLSPVYADAGQLGQVLVNLALNARDAMQATNGGTLTIETANTTLDDVPEAAADDASASGGSGLAAGDYVRLTVRDTGTGMDAATLARAFEPFFTTKPHGRGTGLGLATVYGIVKQSSGDIQAESTPGAGSTFAIVLPVATAERRRSARAVDADHGPAAISFPDTTSRPGHRGVLLVEDNAGVRAFAAEVLSQAGYDVRSARHGAEALELMRKYESSIDVVVTDVVMPEMGGRALVDQLRKRRPHLPVLYITGYTDDASMLEELKSAGARMLEKPFTAGALAEAVALLGTPLAKAS